MIDFDEELKKFQPVTDVEDAEEVIYRRDLTDLTDVMQQMIRGRVSRVNDAKKAERVNNS